jgi:endonuclease YncB( thermonuclease family)
MTLKLKVFLVALVVVLAGCGKSEITVSKIFDGDTILLKDDSVVRLLQIDTPELSTNECYANEARQVLLSLFGLEEFPSTDVPSSTKNEIPTVNITLEADESTDKTDKYGRDLRYVFYKDININLKLVELGAATPYFYSGVKGKYALELENAVAIAQAEKRGLWAQCPSTVYDPYNQLTTNSSAITPSDQEPFVTNSGNCSENYRECVPQYPPDYDCGDLKDLGLIHVTGEDVHGLDRDGDGLACESNARP